MAARRSRDGGAGGGTTRPFLSGRETMVAGGAGLPRPPATGALGFCLWGLPTGNPLAHRALTCGGALLAYGLFLCEPLAGFCL
jgi:hypothetical protein